MPLLADLSPLRTQPHFRSLFIGRTISVLGQQFTAVAAPFQVFLLTGSTLQVGLLALGQIPALLIGSLVGGSLADAYDRRRLMLVAQVLLAATTAGLAANASSTEPHLWLIYLLTALSAGLSGLDSPTRAAATPSLVSASQLSAAMALNQISIQLAVMVGPAIAGVVIARGSIAVAFWVDALSFGVSWLFLLGLPSLVPEGGGTKAGRASVLEGWAVVRRSPVVQGTFIIDINAMVFGMPRALFPEFGTTVFGGGSITVGLLYSAPGAGALLGAVTSGWLHRTQRQGRAVLLAVAAWGTAIAAFGFSPWLWLALLMLAIAGYADMVSAVFRSTIVQLAVPDRLRGRLSAMHIAVVTGGPRLGDAESGMVAAATNVRVAAWSGGLACIAGVGLVSRFMPALGGWTPDTATEVDEVTA